MAALVKEHGLTLLTKDRHFEQVEGIRVEKL
ncbi:PIN domain-containing protein [Flavilitoribacter nigricans]